MNYGYSGTKELNEALVSRFAVIQMPMIAKESLIKLIRKNSPAIREDAAEELAALFLDLQKNVKMLRFLLRHWIFEAFWEQSI